MTIIAEQSLLDESSTPPSTGYAPQAVQFTGVSGAHGKCEINLASLTCTDNGMYSWAGWFKAAWDSLPFTQYLWVVDHLTASTPNFFPNGSTQWSLQDVIQVYVNTSHWPNNTWLHFMGAADLNHAAGSKRMTHYTNGVKTVDATSNDTGAAHITPLNGKDFTLGGDGYGDDFTVKIADFSFWPGVNFMTSGTSNIDPSVVALFRDGSGAPVDPTVAIAALGAPAIMCKGGVAGFLANTLGTNGALHVPSGYDSPVDITDHP